MEEQHSMIELQGIIKRFYIGQPNELEILHGIDLKVNRGEFVSICRFFLVQEKRP